MNFEPHNPTIAGDYYQLLLDAAGQGTVEVVRELLLTGAWGALSRQQITAIFLAVDGGWRCSDWEYRGCYGEIADLLLNAMQGPFDQDQAALLLPMSVYLNLPDLFEANFLPSLPQSVLDKALGNAMCAKWGEDGAPPDATTTTQAMVRKLLAAGANVNAEDADGRAFVLEELCRASPGVEALVLAAKPNANHQDKAGVPLILHSLDHHAEVGYIALRLVEAGADPKARHPESGATVLHHPTVFMWEEYIAPLVKAGADVNAQKHDGNTPLHEAVQRRETRAIRELLRCGANTSMENVAGMTPAQLASSLGLAYIADLFVV